MLVDALRHTKGVLIHKQLQTVVQELLQGRGIAQRTPENDLKMSRDLLSKSGSKRRLPNASHTQQRHQLTLLTKHPAFQLFQFMLATRKARDIQCFAPIFLVSGVRYLNW